MIMVKLMGGLGNQMFEYAAARALAAKHNTTVSLDLTFLLDRTPRENFTFRDFDMPILTHQGQVASDAEVKHFTEIRKTLAGRAMRKMARMLKPVHYYKEPHFHHSSALLECPDNTYIEGYFQSPKYFNAIADTIRHEFRFAKPMQDTSQAMLAQIQAQASPVCINIRRGDFVDNPDVNRVLGVCDEVYYRSSADKMVERHPDAHFFVFSDDIPWCRDNLNLPYPTTFVDHEFAGPKFRDYFELMQRCHHYVIPNSSFGWWAAWLGGGTEKTVFAPSRWMADPNLDTSDVTPENWILN